MSWLYDDVDAPFLAMCFAGIMAVGAWAYVTREPVDPCELVRECVREEIDGTMVVLVGGFPHTIPQFSCAEHGPPRPRDADACARAGGAK